MKVKILICNPTIVFVTHYINHTKKSDQVIHCFSIVIYILYVHTAPTSPDDLCPTSKFDLGALYFIF